MRVRLILSIIMVWVGGMGTMTLINELTKVPVVSCPAAGAPVMEAAPYRFQEPRKVLQGEQI